MPTDYTGTDSYANTMPIPADGDKRKAASVNPAFEQLLNNTKHLKDNAAFKFISQAISGAWTFSNFATITGIFRLFGRLCYSAPTELANNVADQDIDLETGPVYLLFKPTGSMGPRFLRLPLTGVNDGEIVIFSFYDIAVSSGAFSMSSPTETYTVIEDGPGPTLAEFALYHEDDSDVKVTGLTATWAAFRYSSVTGHWKYLIGSGYVRPAGTLTSPL